MIWIIGRIARAWFEWRRRIEFERDRQLREAYAKRHPWHPKSMTITDELIREDVRHYGR